jgi:hypothetical protein
MMGASQIQYVRTAQHSSGTVVSSIAAVYVLVTATAMFLIGLLRC